GGAPEAGKAAVRFQKRFLDQVGGIHLPLKAAADLEPGEEGEVAAVVFQEASQGVFLPSLRPAQQLLWTRVGAGRHHSTPHKNGRKTRAPSAARDQENRACRPRRSTSSWAPAPCTNRRRGRSTAPRRLSLPVMRPEGLGEASRLAELLAEPA